MLQHQQEVACSKLFLQYPHTKASVSTHARGFASHRAKHDLLSMLRRLNKQELTWAASMLQSKQFATMPSMPVRCRAGLIEPCCITTHF